MVLSSAHIFPKRALKFVHPDSIMRSFQIFALNSGCDSKIKGILPRDFNGSET
jgi:hypothetical protein